MTPSQQDVAADIGYLLLSAGLASIRRFHRQPFWEAEGMASDEAMRIEGGLRLESVADHSWKVADAVCLLADHFPELDRARAIELALMHDKLELIIGDWSPIDAQATGQSTHAFNPNLAAKKRADEITALDVLLENCRPDARPWQRALFSEMIERRTPEARFVAAVDKLASLLFVMDKKRRLDPSHLEFTLRYAAKSVELFPALSPYYECLRELLVEQQAVWPFVRKVAEPC